MERDFPIGHPAASDYNGEEYNPPRAPYSEDFPEGHPARDGKNVSPLDTADGLREALRQQTTDLLELASVGSLPPLIDDTKSMPVDLSPEQLALLYALRNGLLPEQERAEAGEKIVAVLLAFGYEEARAQELISNYCFPISQK